MSGDKDMGNRIINRRKEMGFSRDEFSGLLGLSMEQTAAIELGKRATSVKTLRKIANILCVSTDYILVGEPSPDSLRSSKSKLLKLIERNITEDEAMHYISIFKTLQRLTV